MKNLLTILALVFAGFSAHAQGFLQQAQTYSLITNRTTWMNVSSNGGTVAANFVTTQAPWVPIGASGFGVGVKAYATNAALTTNVWITLELSADGVNAITNNTLTVVYLPTGVATNTYYTNFYLPTDALRGNTVAVRAKNIMSTNGIVGSSLAGNLFVEKFYINTR